VKPVFGAAPRRLATRSRGVSVGRGRGVPANRAQVGREHFRVIGSGILEYGYVAIRDNRGVELIAPKHLECLALSIVIDASEPRANEHVPAAHAFNKPTPRAQLDEVTGRR